MRKLFIVLVSALLIGVSVQARAEQSTSTFTGERFEEQQVFIFAYNNSGSEVQSNGVVVVDITGTGSSTLGTYFTTSGTSGNSYILGVTDETIAIATIGKICVRGPHIVNFATAPSAGDTITNHTVVPQGLTETSTANKYGYVGVALKATAAEDGDDFNLDGVGSENWWIWVNPTVQ